MKRDERTWLVVGGAGGGSASVGEEEGEGVAPTRLESGQRRGAHDELASDKDVVLADPGVEVVAEEGGGGLEGVEVRVVGQTASRVAVVRAGANSLKAQRARLTQACNTRGCKRARERTLIASEHPRRRLAGPLVGRLAPTLSLFRERGCLVEVRLLTQRGGQDRARRYSLPESVARSRPAPRRQLSAGTASLAQRPTLHTAPHRGHFIGSQRPTRPPLCSTASSTPRGDQRTRRSVCASRGSANTSRSSASNSRTSKAQTAGSYARCAPPPLASPSSSDCTLTSRLAASQFAVGLVAAVFGYSYYVYVVRLCIPMIRMEDSRLGAQAQGRAFATPAPETRLPPR